MEIPNSNTPVAKCLDLAAYASQTMGHFTPPGAELQELANKLSGARLILEQKESAYATADMNMIPVRVNVTLANYTADEGIKQAQRTAEVADGEKNGPIVLHLFPRGTTPIVKPFGAAQVKEMRDLEGRYDAVLQQWPDAQKEKNKVTTLRLTYEQALQGRADAAQLVNDLRAQRDLAKKNFLNVYAEVANRIRALFPRNKKKQDLFFDALTPRAVTKQNAENGDAASP